MRTDYNGSDTNGNNDDWLNAFTEGSKDSVYNQIDRSVSKAVLKEDLMKAYQEIEMSIALRDSENTSAYNESVYESNKAIKEEMYNNLNNYTINEPEGINGANDINAKEPQQQLNDSIPKKEKSKAKAIIISVTAFVIVVTVGVSAYVIRKGNVANKEGNVNSSDSVSSITENDVTVEKIQKKIDLLYTDESKSAIKDGYTVADLDVIREEIDSISKDTDTSALVSEVDTISKYLSSYAVLTAMESPDYNIEPEEVKTSCDNIQGELSSYTVGGLSNTLLVKITAITTERNEYLKIKSELSSISDYVNWNSDGYSDRIDKITHKDNKSELSNLLSEANANKKNAVAKQKAEKLKKEAEEAKKKAEEAKNKKEKEKAQKALKEAQKKQQEAEKSLQDTQKKLEEAQKKATTAPITQTEPAPSDQTSLDAEQNQESQAQTTAPETVPEM